MAALGDAAALKRKMDLENAVAPPAAAKKAHVDAAAVAAADPPAPVDEAARQAEAETVKMMAAVRTWDIATLKKFIAALPKAQFGARQDKKAEMVDTVERAIRRGLFGPKPAASYRGYATADELRRVVRDAFACASSAREGVAARKAMDPATRALETRVAPLDKAQLVDIVLKLAARDRAAVEAVLPSQGDTSAVLADLAYKVKAIRKALPNSRWGSTTDAYGYKRAASANKAAEKAFKDAVATYRKAKHWPTAAAFADRALPIARDMVRFDCPQHNGTRYAVMCALTKLKQDAAIHAAGA